MLLVVLKRAGKRIIGTDNQGRAGKQAQIQDSGIEGWGADVFQAENERERQRGVKQEAC